MTVWRIKCEVLLDVEFELDADGEDEARALAEDEVRWNLHNAPIIDVDNIEVYERKTVTP